MKPEAKGWRDLYDFDVPVVSVTPCRCIPDTSADRAQIHISKAELPEEVPEKSSAAFKLMHRFTPEEVKAKMDLAEKA